MTWKQSGASANITYYRSGNNDPGEYWCDVLMSDTIRVNGEWVPRTPRAYLFEVHQVHDGVGARPSLGRFTYSPSTGRGPERLSAGTVARLVNRWLLEYQGG